MCSSDSLSKDLLNRILEIESSDAPDTLDALLIVSPDEPFHTDLSSLLESAHNTFVSTRNVDFHSIYCHEAAHAHSCRVVFVAGVLFGLSTAMETSDSRDRSERNPSSTRTRAGIVGKH